MTKIEYRTLNDRAYEELRKGLIEGSFRPGQPLVIRSLAETYGISTTPVREALQRLVAERLLEMLPNRSIAVPPLSVEKFKELARIRCALEGLAGELATLHVRKTHLQRLRRLLKEADAAIEERDGRAYVQVNQRFHFVVYENSNSPLLLQMIQDLWSKVGPFFNKLFDDVDYLPKANSEHLQIVGALELGDAAAVRRHIVEDIMVAARSLTPRLQASSAAGTRTPALVEA